MSSTFTQKNFLLCNYITVTILCKKELVKIKRMHCTKRAQTQKLGTHPHQASLPTPPPPSSVCLCPSTHLFQLHEYIITHIVLRSKVASLYMFNVGNLLTVTFIIKRKHSHNYERSPGRYSQVGLISFSNNHTIHFHLNQFRSQGAVWDAIDQVPWIHGNTNTADALKAVSRLIC